MIIQSSRKWLAGGLAATDNDTDATLRFTLSHRRSGLGRRRSAPAALPLCVLAAPSRPGASPGACTTWQPGPSGPLGQAAVEVGQHVGEAAERRFRHARADLA